MKNAMIVITKAQKVPETEKRYSVATVSQAIGRSESGIGSFFSNQHISVRKGITIGQIAEYLEYVTKPGNKRGEAIIWGDVYEIRNKLPKHGFSVCEQEIPEQLRTETD